MYKNKIECLEAFKNGIINLGKKYNQKKFITDCFTRWYISSELDECMFPTQNLILIGIEDIKFGNHKKNLKFNVAYLIKEGNLLHKKFKYICHNVKTEIYNFDYKKYIKKKQEDNLKRLYELYNGQIDIKYPYYRNKLIFLYKFIGMNTMHLSMPPIFKGIELFGSPLNTHNDSYCSPFDLEKNFNSLGSFWKYKFHKDGLYLCNPPFDENIILNMCKTLIQNLDDTEFQIVIMITIPVLDSKSQKKLNIKDFGLSFPGYDCIIESKYFKDQEILDKDIYPYYNYYTDSLAPASYTHLILLSNIEDKTYKDIMDIQTFKKKWIDYVKQEKKSNLYH